MWARLLVNGTNEITGINIERSFIEIMAQLTHLEGKILESIYSLPFKEIKHTGVVTAQLPKFASIYDRDNKDKLTEPTKEVMLALANLARIGCLKFPLTYGGGEIFTHVHPTLIGKEFIAACTYKQKI